MKKTILLVLLFVGGLLMAQTTSDQSPAKDKKKGQVTVQGCVSRSGGDFILMQADPANSYVLHGTENVKLGQYLGQQVKVTGTKSATVSDSADAGRSVPPVTITVDSISTVSKECKS